MTPRFRIIAGPNGSGKTTLCARLTAEFAVNFYTMLNADALFAEAMSHHAFRATLPVEPISLLQYLEACSYPPEVLAPFRDGRIVVKGDCFHFRDVLAINSYTVSLITNFLRHSMMASGLSFSQETVFSHPEKVEALRDAKERGYRTYLYFVATDNPVVNAFRVKSRTAKGGHDVPPDKIVARYGRSLQQIAPSLPFLSRAFFWDNSGEDFRFLAAYDDQAGFTLETDDFPAWFRANVPIDFHA